ncbi:MAG TPA: GTP-binding protein [Kineosporiaceae bacterium]|nr:GTP-binding protein [Kineosporiaceae bacterium]
MWTVDLHSWRPVHPGRLFDRIEDLGAGPRRGRGRLRLANRPDEITLWDGAGGQLAIGSTPLRAGGPAWLWTPDACAATAPSTGAPSSRLVITGVDERRDHVVRAFDQILLTDAQIARGRRWWRGRADGFGPWLGPASGEQGQHQARPA